MRAFAIRHNRGFRRRACSASTSLPWFQADRTWRCVARRSCVWSTVVARRSAGLTYPILAKSMVVAWLARVASVISPGVLDHVSSFSSRRLILHVIGGSMRNIVAQGVRQCSSDRRHLCENRHRFDAPVDRKAKSLTRIARSVTDAECSRLSRRARDNGGRPILS